MSDLELVKKDVERYYKEQDEKGYNMVKDLRNSNLFNFETVLMFAAMYHATKRMEEPTSDEPALNIDLVSGMFAYHPENEEECRVFRNKITGKWYYDEGLAEIIGWSNVEKLKS
jgi:hypothetical protein